MAGFALAPGSVSVVGLGSSWCSGDSGAVALAVAISVSPTALMVNAQAGVWCAHTRAVVVCSQARVVAGPGVVGRRRETRRAVAKERDCSCECGSRNASGAQSGACTSITRKAFGELQGEGASRVTQEIVGASSLAAANPRDHPIPRSFPTLQLTSLRLRQQRTWATASALYTGKY